MAVVRPQRGEVYLISLRPTRGREIRKPRPCVVISPDELNEHLQTLLVAPLTTGGHPYPFRIACRFQKRKGYVVLDQVRLSTLAGWFAGSGNCHQPRLGLSFGSLFVRRHGSGIPRNPKAGDRKDFDQ